MVMIMLWNNVIVLRLSGLTKHPSPPCCRFLHHTGQKMWTGYNVQPNHGLLLNAVAHGRHGATAGDIF